MGLITAVPAQIRIHDDELKMVEISFLCVHKKLRSAISLHRNKLQDSFSSHKWNAQKLKSISCELALRI